MFFIGLFMRLWDCIRLGNRDFGNDMRCSVKFTLFLTVRFSVIIITQLTEILNAYEKHI